jgi:hypothetical protein
LKEKTSLIGVLSNLESRELLCRLAIIS